MVAGLRAPAWNPGCSDPARPSAPATCSSWMSRRPSSTWWASRSPTRCAGDRSRSRTRARPPLQRRATLVDGTDAARFRAQTLVPVAMLFMVLQLLVATAAVVSFTARTPQRQGVPATVCPGHARLRPGRLSGATVPVPPAGRSALLGVPRRVLRRVRRFRVVRRRRQVVDALHLGLGATVALLVVDVVLGSSLQLDSAFGFSPEIAGRFIGFGNVSYALLAAAAILLAGLLAHRLGRRGGPWWASRSGGRTVADGAPFWGADVGGMLTMVPAFALAARLLGKPVRRAPCSSRSVRRSSALPLVTVSTCFAPGLRVRTWRDSSSRWIERALQHSPPSAPQARHEPVDHHDVALAPALRPRARVRRLPRMGSGTRLLPRLLARPQLRAVLCAV